MSQNACPVKPCFLECNYLKIYDEKYLMKLRSPIQEIDPGRKKYYYKVKHCFLGQWTHI